MTSYAVISILTVCLLVDIYFSQLYININIGFNIFMITVIALLRMIACDRIKVSVLSDD